ncbi:MAG: DUF4398 domain-containing protein [Deltaproteobacteria bacterium]|nr:DUF4398 domain-containing protein [Deltaproteobacteria bacterium]
MITRHVLATISCAGFFVGCAATAPAEIVGAREAYQRASKGPAARMAPADLHVASQALTVAERSFQEDPNSYRTGDLAYVAERRAQIAEVTASISLEKHGKARSEEAYQKTQDVAVQQ